MRILETEVKVALSDSGEFLGLMYRGKLINLYAESSYYQYFSCDFVGFQESSDIEFFIKAIDEKLGEM